MTQLLEGGPVAEALLNQTKEMIEKSKLAPALAIVRVGERPDDIAYERNIIKQAEKAGISVKLLHFEQSISSADLLRKVCDLNWDKDVHGILLFKPFPKHIDEKTIISILSPAKDVDGITPTSLSGVFMDQHRGHRPCTAEACIETLHYYGIALSGKKVTVLGRSLTIGKPVALMVMNEGATVTVCHSKTPPEELRQACQGADILIAAIGKARTIGQEHICSGQIVLDVGINLDEGGRLCGDVDFAAASKIAEQITPVPGGIGTVTTAILMKHITEAAHLSYPKE